MTDSEKIKTPNCECDNPSPANYRLCKCGGLSQKKEFGAKRLIKYNLEIKPAVPIELRHKLAAFLEQEGYNVWSQGQFTNDNICDINFEIEEDSNETPETG